MVTTMMIIIVHILLYNILLYFQFIYVFIIPHIDVWGFCF